MSHNVAGIDIHKKLLVVVIVDAAEPDVPLQSRRFGTGAAELSHLLGWLLQYAVREAVMESTAQYGKPVWMELEPQLRLHLAPAQSNRATALICLIALMTSKKEPQAIVGNRFDRSTVVRQQARSTNKTTQSHFCPPTFASRWNQPRGQLIYNLYIRMRNPASLPGSSPFRGRGPKNDLPEHALPQKGNGPGDYKNRNRDGPPVVCRSLYGGKEPPILIGGLAVAQFSVQRLDLFVENVLKPNVGWCFRSHGITSWKVFVFCFRE
jgi:hypothetical protein